MKKYIIDLEFDGLIENATKSHCLSWHNLDSEKSGSITDYQGIRKFFDREDILLIGHNLIVYDIPLTEKLLKIKIKAKIWDTLAISWAIFPDRNKHGLEEWGEYFGIKKPPITDWSGLSVEQYVHRCEEDVKINTRLWKKEWKELMSIYEGNEAEAIRYIEYLAFKMDCVREQEEEGINLDIPYIHKALEDLKKIKEDKAEVLKRVMPKVAIKKIKEYKDVIIVGEDFYEKGDMMYAHYLNQNYPTKDSHIIETIKGWEEPNPNSVPQKKAWLFSLGWQPINFKKVEREDGTIDKIPQIASAENDGTLCESVQLLFDKCPELAEMEGISILTHRIGLLEGFLRNSDENGIIKASMLGFTNTLRLKHRNIVNLPNISKKYAKEIRGSIIAPEGMILCGSDLAALEDTCKQHYIYKYDPEYVKELRTPGYCPHLALGVRGEIMTLEETEFYKWYDEEKGKPDFHPTEEQKERFQEIKDKRFVSKTTNFTCLYGAGADRIAETARIKLKQAKQLHTIYWQMNHSVKKVANDCIVKLVGINKWLYNPVSRFWYSLRAEKDRFSTLNQSTGAYIFDLYVKYTRATGIKIALQYHDEELFKTYKEKKREIRKALEGAIRQVNEEVKLNIPIGMSVEFGDRYSNCH